MPQRVTEKEARNLWCRHGFILHYASHHTGMASAAINRGFKDHKSDGPMCFCLGSGCAAWTWFDDEEADGDKGKRKGFCGAETW